MSGFTVITDSQVFVKVSSNATTFSTERRVQKDMTIGELKSKLELQTGCNSASMKLEVFDKSDKLVCRLDDDTALFGSFPVENEMRLHVTDPTKRLGEFEDVSKVEKFELSAEEYAKKTDTVRAFKERMKLGRFSELDPEEQERREREKRENEEREIEAASRINVGDRCEVRVPKAPTRRGTVMFVGDTDFKPGKWVGIKYDEPVGKNNGRVEGRQYFECPPKYGGFVKPENVTVGDFPEDGLDSDLDEL